MSIKVEIKLRNDTSDDVLCTIPKGHIFENKKLGIKLQNVAAARDYQLIIPAKSRINAEIECLCINRYLGSPTGEAGNITIFKIDQPFESQQQLWNIIATPRA